MKGTNYSLNTISAPNAFNIIANGNVLIGKSTQVNSSYMLDVAENF